MHPDSEPDTPEPPQIRRLRRLVTALTLVMIAGVATITGLLAWRLSTAPATSAPTLPETISLPDGERLTGWAMNTDWTVLIAEDAAGRQWLHLVRRGAEGIHQSVAIDPPG